MSDWQRVKMLLETATALVGGTLAIVTGLIGYDTGRRAYGPGIVERSRWTGEIGWFSVFVGVALIGFGLWRVQQLRGKR